MNRPNVLKRTVKVLLPLPLADAYDYSVPDGLEVAAGHFVIVPLGKRETVGVVWGEGSGEVPPEKLRDIAHVLPALPMADPLRRFVDWVSAYTLAPPGAVLRMAMSVPSALEAPKTEIVYRAANQPDDAALKLTAARRRVLEQLKDGPAMPAAELAHIAGVGTSVIKTMASIGLLEGVERTMRRSFAQPDGKQQGPALSPEQAVAAQGLVDKVLAHAFSATLLDGVPGAGKTEVYFEAIAAALASGRQVLVLLPEIALTAQWLKRFEDRFGALPAAWHSGLTSLERRETWRAIAEGRVRRRGRRALGAVPAVQHPRPDRGRRGARQFLQAGRGRRPTMRATWPWCARGWSPRRSCSPRRRPRSRASSTSPRAATARCTCRPATAARNWPSFRRSISGAIRRRAAAGCRRRSSRR